LRGGATPRANSRGDAHDYGEGVALRDLASSVELLRRYVAWENRYVISVEGDRPQRKLVEGTEMVKWPFRSCDLLARRSAKRCLMGSTDQVRRSFKL
jgi:hypothetical protein